MARLIDADIALENIDGWLDTVGTALIGRGLSCYAELQGCIEDAPTVDAVPVVHCKDCTYTTLYEDSDGVYCTNICGLYTRVMDDDFCSYGERKDGDAE